MKALEQATLDEDPIAPSDYFARQADALVDLARAYLAGSKDKTTGTADHYQGLIHVDESALRGAGGRADLPPVIRRALMARDRHCAFPGCTHDRYLDAHHVRHWVDGGQTWIDNLVLLCTQHHRACTKGGSICVATLGATSISSRHAAKRSRPVAAMRHWTSATATAPGEFPRKQGPQFRHLEFPRKRCRDANRSVAAGRDVRTTQPHR